jgi:acetyl esterase/lipase
MVWPWLFLAVSLVGAAFTANAYRPRPPTHRLAVASFFAGWFTAELVAHHLAWQFVATLGFLWLGALAAWPGWLGLAITISSWIALAAMLPVARRSEQGVEDALCEGLGADYRDATGALEKLRDALWLRGRGVNPFRFRHPDVTVVRNLRYADGFGKRHLLDVYTPRGGTSGAPVLLQIHGGAWVLGHKQQQALPLLNHLAARGWVCAAANYRLSPKATFPEHVIDVKLALRWIREHIAEYGGDPRFVAITGGSAGGHLAALAALTANDPEYQPGFEDADTSVQAAVPFYGVYDFTDRQGLDPKRGVIRFLERQVLKKKFADDRDAFDRASPMSRVHDAAPPFLVVHGASDSLVPVRDARHFALLLRASSKQPVCYVELPQAQHAFEIFHSLRTRNIVQGVDRFLAFAYATWLARERNRDAA